MTLSCDSEQQVKLVALPRNHSKKPPSNEDGFFYASRSTPSLMDML